MKNKEASSNPAAPAAQPAAASAAANLEARRHSLAHLLGRAVLTLYPSAHLATGPATETGFFYDIDPGTDASGAPIKIGDDALPAIQKEMRSILNRKSWKDGFTCKEVSEKEARQLFAKNPYKLTIIGQIVERGEKITVYTSGAGTKDEFVDLCRGGHMDAADGFTSETIEGDSFKLTQVSGAYWNNDEKAKMLARISGLAFASKADLDTHIAMQAEAEKRDHRKLGRELGLFVFSDVVGKGLPLWTEKGATVRRELERFIVDEEIRRGYLHVQTPDIAKLELYKKSGHYPYYKDSMYAPIEIDGDEFMLRPMTCPHHFELYSSQPRSYRELPMRLAELAKLYRYEQSGELSGLVRVRSFCLADAHIICADPDQAKSEVTRALDLIEYVAEVFGLKMGQNYSYRLSLGNRANDKKYFKDDAAWDLAEDKLRQVLKERKCTFVEAADEAAFYGPKIDIQMRDVRGKENTAFTVQYDFVMPKRFNLRYVDRDGAEKEALVVHRSSIGAIERIMAFLIEHYAGKFPLWLAPVQAMVIPVDSEKHGAAAEAAAAKLREAGLRVKVDVSDDGFGKKVRTAKTELVPYFIILGDKDIEAGVVTFESRDNGKIGAMKIEEVVEKLKKEVGERV